ncbi:MAG: prolipoprotein diacylglyceryl transferase family protein [Elusimicrobiota bacterium]
MHPVLFSIGGFAFVASPVFAGLGAILAFLYVRHEKGYAGLSEDGLWDLMLLLALGTIAGSFIMYFFFYGGGMERNLPRIWSRGFCTSGAFYGAYWGALAGCFAASRWKSLSFPKIADIVANAAPLGLSLTRVGCLLQGCCHGKITTGPLYIVFTDPRSSVRHGMLNMPLHPTQLYESAGALLIFLFSHYYILARSKRKELPAGYAFAATTLFYAALRFSTDFLRGKDPGTFQPFGLTTAQFVSIMGAGLAFGLAWRWKKAS